MHVRKIFSSQKASFSCFLHELDPSRKPILEIAYKSYTFWYLHHPSLSGLFNSGMKDVVTQVHQHKLTLFCLGIWTQLMTPPTEIDVRPVWASWRLYLSGLFQTLDSEFMQIITQH